jgi:hypothetical protein
MPVFNCSLRVIVYLVALCIFGIFCFTAIESPLIDTHALITDKNGHHDLSGKLSKAIIIEPRDLPHALPFSIANVCVKTGVPIVLFHSQKNVPLAKSIQGSSACPVTLVDIDLTKGPRNQMWYNNFVLGLDFWSRLDTDGTVLLFQSDSGICGDSARADQFASYDLCGAGWGWPVDSWRGSKVGNGGFTIRNVKKMKQYAAERQMWSYYAQPVHLRWALSGQSVEMTVIACIIGGPLCAWRFGLMRGTQWYSWWHFIVMSVTLGVVISVANRMNHMAEDTYFSNSCAADKDCLVCPHAVAMDFCEEGEPNIDAWAFHNNWAIEKQGWANKQHGPICEANEKIAMMHGGPQKYLHGGPTANANYTIRYSPMGAVDAFQLVSTTCTSKVNIGVLERHCYLLFGAIISVVWVSGAAALLICVRRAAHWGQQKTAVEVSPKAQRVLGKEEGEFTQQPHWGGWVRNLVEVCVGALVLLSVPCMLIQHKGYVGGKRR